MNYIKSLHIEGFKKFILLDVQFNERMNILVGENEAGKSTILDALKTVLNQQYRNTDKSVLRDLFNTQMVTKFNRFHTEVHRVGLNLCPVCKLQLYPSLNTPEL